MVQPEGDVNVGEWRLGREDCRWMGNGVDTQQEGTRLTATLDALFQLLHIYSHAPLSLLSLSHALDRFLSCLSRGSRYSGTVSSRRLGRCTLITRSLFIFFVLFTAA